MSPVFQKTALPEIIEIRPLLHRDSRGFFYESYNRDALRAEGIDIEWVQDNHSLSRQPHVLRGLHFQSPPHAQDKLIRVVHGSILDVAVDIRVGSPRYARHVAIVLSAEEGNQLLVPRGFAHGFLTLEPDTEVLYKVSDFYAPEFDRSIRYDDPQIGIDWGLAEKAPILSGKDADAPLLRDCETGFHFADVQGQT